MENEKRKTKEAMEMRSYEQQVQIDLALKAIEFAADMLRSLPVKPYYMLDEKKP